MLELIGIITSSRFEGEGSVRKLSWLSAGDRDISTGVRPNQCDLCGHAIIDVAICFYIMLRAQQWPVASKRGGCDRVTTPPSDTPPTSACGATRLTDYAGEATGFGAAELRTFRDLLLRPGQVLQAYLEQGPTGGGRYARPMGFYLALCGVLMFFIFLVGGLKGILEQQPIVDLGPWIGRSGKTREAFIDDADSWMSLAANPILSIFYAVAVASLLKWWGSLDWRLTFRASFALLCAWTVPLLLLGPLPLVEGFQLFGAVVMWAALIIAFLRMGRGLWWTSWPGGAAKSIILLVALFIAGQLGMVPVFYIGLLGGLYAA